MKSHEHNVSGPLLPGCERVGIRLSAENRGRTNAGLDRSAPNRPKRNAAPRRVRPVPCLGRRLARRGQRRRPSRRAPRARSGCPASSRSLPVSRTTRRVIGWPGRGSGFCSGPTTKRSSSTDLVAAGATKRKPGPSAGEFRFDAIANGISASTPVGALSLSARCRVRLSACRDMPDALKAGAVVLGRDCSGPWVTVSGRLQAAVCWRCGRPALATFDCYATLVDWNAGIRAELDRLFGAEPDERLLSRYHTIEPHVPDEHPAWSYRQVTAVPPTRSSSSSTPRCSSCDRRHKATADHVTTSRRPLFGRRARASRGAGPRPNPRLRGHWTRARRRSPERGGFGRSGWLDVGKAHHPERVEKSQPSRQDRDQ